MAHDTPCRQAVRGRKNLMAGAAHIQNIDALTVSVKQRIGPCQASGESDLTRVAYYPVGHTIADVVQHLILDTLEYCHGNRTDAARTLGISIRTLRNRLRDYRKAGILIASSSRKQDVSA